MKFISIILLIMITTIAPPFVINPQAATVDPLAGLHHDLAVKRLYAMKPVLNSYLSELDKLIEQFQKAGETNSIRDAREEKAMIESELTRLARAVEQTKVKIPPPPVDSPPTSAPALANHQARNHVDSTRGLAGAPSFSKHNIYNFFLPEVGSTSTLTFYATGRRSIESVGNVWLITPSGRREKVARWKGSNFDDPATEINNYKELRPITEDVSEFIKTPGTYQVEFEWTDGIDPLVIFRVEITS